MSTSTLWSSLCHRNNFACSLFLNKHFKRGIIGAYHITFAGILFLGRSLWQNHPNYAGPRVPIIVQKISNCCTQKSDNPVVCRLSSGNPESSTFYNSYRMNNGVTTTLQYLVQKLIYIEVWKISNISLQNMFK
jgi:hypothetical protein